MCAFKLTHIQSGEWFFKGMLYPDSKLGWENPLKSNGCISQNREPVYAYHENWLQKEPVQRCAASPMAWSVALSSWPLPTQCPQEICPLHPQLTATPFFSSSGEPWITPSLLSCSGIPHPICQQPCGVKVHRSPTSSHQSPCHYPNPSHHRLQPVR